MAGKESLAAEFEALALEAMRLAALHPPYRALLESFIPELRRYAALSRLGRALSEGEQAGVDLGRVAVRELDDVVPEYVTRISEACRTLRMK